MAEITLEQVYREACQLPPEEQEELIERLKAVRQAHAVLDPRLDLLVFDVGPWPDGLTLRREDEYGDAQR